MNVNVMKGFSYNKLMDLPMSTKMNFLWIKKNSFGLNFLNDNNSTQLAEFKVNKLND